MLKRKSADYRLTLDAPMRNALDDGFPNNSSGFPALPHADTAVIAKVASQTILHLTSKKLNRRRDGRLSVRRVP